MNHHAQLKGWIFKLHFIIFLNYNSIYWVCISCLAQYGNLERNNKQHRHACFPLCKTYKTAEKKLKNYKLQSMEQKK